MSHHDHGPDFVDRYDLPQTSPGREVKDSTAKTKKRTEKAGSHNSSSKKQSSKSDRNESSSASPKNHPAKLSKAKKPAPEGKQLETAIIEPGELVASREIGKGFFFFTFYFIFIFSYVYGTILHMKERKSFF